MMAAQNNTPGELSTSDDGSTPSGYCDQHESYEIGCAACAEADIKLCESRIEYLDKKLESLDNKSLKFNKFINKIDGYYSVIRSHEEFIEKQRIENHPLLNISSEQLDLYTKDFDRGSFGLRLHVQKLIKKDGPFEIYETDQKLAEIEINTDDENGIPNSYLLADALMEILEEDDIQERIKTKFFELLKEKLEEEA